MGGAVAEGGKEVRTVEDGFLMMNESIDMEVDSGASTIHGLLFNISPFKHSTTVYCPPFTVCSPSTQHGTTQACSTRFATPLNLNHSSGVGKLF